MMNAIVCVIVYLVYVIIYETPNLHTMKQKAEVMRNNQQLHNMQDGVKEK